jgi:hypothetical protein
VATKPEGFFARDKDFGQRMDEAFEPDEQFVILSMNQDTPFVNPKNGEQVATRTKMMVRRFSPETLQAFGVPFEVKTLSQNIYERAAQVADGDFPAVCYYSRVPVEKWNNEATVIRLVAPYPLPAEYAEYMDSAE